MVEVKMSSLIKPSINTPFHVDFDWWRATDNNWHVALQGLLCPEHQEAFSNLQEGQLIDWVNPETAEVRQMDGLQHIIINHCAKEEGFLNDHTAIVEGVFRLLLANGNSPISAEGLGKKLNRPADTILKTIAGSRVYRGLRPYNP
jgi:hypothetical protein